MTDEPTVRVTSTWLLGFSNRCCGLRSSVQRGLFIRSYKLHTPIGIATPQVVAGMKPPRLVVAGALDMPEQVDDRECRCEREEAGKFEACASIAMPPITVT